jgi:hypothetical protein
MHIQLLPATRPPERTPTPAIPRVDMVPGQRVTALVLSPDLDGRSMLAFAGREMPTRSAVPFPPGTRLLLEVVDASIDGPTVRIVEPRQTPAPAVSPATYGYAAAVLAAETAEALAGARGAVARWLPLLVSRGVITAAQAAGLAHDLGPVVPRRHPGGPERRSERRDDPPQPQALADGLATRLARDPGLLEARLAVVLRQGQGGDAAESLLYQDLRGRLAQLAKALAAAPMDAALTDARDSVARLQAALLGEQARSAAHFAREGVLDVHLPLALGAQDVEVRVRVSDAPADSDATGGVPTRRVQLDLDLDGLGRVQVRVDAAGGTVRTELVTERATAADAIEGGLDELSDALSHAGFRDVLTRVVIDPIRIAGADTPLDLPPEGSIVNVDA